MLLAVAGTALAAVGDRRHPAAIAARAVYLAAAPLAMVAFVAWLAVVRMAGSAQDPATVLVLADTIGWITSRADWVATILVVGVGPGLLSYSGRGSWVPPWLNIWGALAVITAILTGVAFFAGGLTTYGFLVVPVGLGWTIAAGVTTLRAR